MREQGRAAAVRSAAGQPALAQPVAVDAHGGSEDRPVGEDLQGQGRAQRGHGIADAGRLGGDRSEEHTYELQSLMRISYAVFCLQIKIKSELETICDKRVRDATSHATV